MHRTLLLDNGYRPIDIIGWKDAIRLLTLDKVEIVENYVGSDIRSMYLVLKMPAVVRLVNRISKRKKTEVTFSRLNIYTRDNWTCQYCRKKCTAKELTFDHVVPKSRGGKTTWTNIVAACARCNSKKGDKTVQGSGFRLLAKPIKPKSLPNIAIRISKKMVPIQWTNYIYWHTTLVET